jgi:hypothetical protein
MRLIGTAISVLSLTACSKPAERSEPKPSEAPAAAPKKPVDTTPLPPLAADPGGATGKPLWSAGFGGLGIDAPRDVTTDDKGDVYVVGYFDGEIDFGGAIGKRAPAGVVGATDKKGKPIPLNSDAFLVKLGGDGKLAWAQTFGDAREDLANAVAVRGDRVVVVGSFLDKLTLGEFTKKSIGSDDAFVAAFNRAGAPEWVWNFGGIDSDGGWIVGGSFSDVGEFGTKPLKSRGKTDAMLLKLQATGDIEWVKQFGGRADDTILDVAVDAQGSIYVQGQFQDLADWGGQTPLKAAGGSDNDIVLAKYDSNGDHQWSQRFGNAFNDVAGGLTVDRSGHVTIVGAIDKTVSFGDGDSHTGIEGDIYVARFDPTGKLVWAKTFGGEREDVGYGVASDTSGNTVVTGWFHGTVNFGKAGPLTSTAKHNKDVFVMKLDPAGEVVWALRAGDKDHDQGRGIAVDGTGAALVAGIYRFRFDLAEPALESVRLQTDRIPKPDVFVTKLAR